MNLRWTVVAALFSLGLGVSGARAQAWSVTDIRDEEPLVPAIRSYAPAAVSSGPTVISGSVYTPAAPTYSAPVSAVYPSSGYATYAAPNYTVYSAPNYVTYAAPSYPAYAGPSYVAPVVSYRPVVAAYAVPAVAYRPAAASCAAPYLAYSPTAATAYTPTAVAAYSPSTYTVSVPVPPGKRVIVHPKVYVEGQPIRNLLKAITP